MISLILAAEQADEVKLVARSTNIWPAAAADRTRHPEVLRAAQRGAAQEPWE